MMELEADYVQSNLIFSKETNLVAKNLSFDSKADWSKLVLVVASTLVGSKMKVRK